LITAFVSRPKTDYGIGIIGCGSIVNHAHLPAYRKFGFKVVACCDIREEAARQTAERFGIPKWFTDYRHLLDLPEVEIVDIAITNRVALRLSKQRLRLANTSSSKNLLPTTWKTLWQWLKFAKSSA
jgi:hypothetical protein